MTTKANMSITELIDAIETDRAILGDLIADDAIEALRDGSRGGRHSEAIDDVCDAMPHLRGDLIRAWNAGCPTFAAGTLTR